MWTKPKLWRVHDKFHWRLAATKAGLVTCTTARICQWDQTFNMWKLPAKQAIVMRVTHCEERKALSWTQGWSEQFVVQENWCADLAVVHHWQAVQEYQSETQRVKQDCYVLLCCEAPGDGLALSARACLGFACYHMASLWTHHCRNRMWAGWTLESPHLHWPATGCYAGRKEHFCKCTDQYILFCSLYQCILTLILQKTATFGVVITAGKTFVPLGKEKHVSAP